MRSLVAILLPFVLGAAIAGAGFYATRPASDALQAEMREKARVEDQLRQQQAGIRSLRAQLEVATLREAEHRNRLQESLASEADKSVRLETAESNLAEYTSRLETTLTENAHLRQTAEEAVALLHETRNRLDTALVDVGRMRGELSVAEAAKDHLAQELIASQEEVGRLRENLAFFEQLIPENSPPAGISIRAVTLAPQGDALQYRVLVMRNSDKTDDFTGTLRFVATGEQGGDSATIDLEPLATAPTSDGTNSRKGTGTGKAPVQLKFKQYQRVNGLLAIPAGFVPHTITVQVLQGKAVRAEHTSKLAPKE